MIAAIVAFMVMPWPGCCTTVMAGTVAGSLVRLRPDSLVLNQLCPSETTGSPARSSSEKPASLESTPSTISSPLRVMASGNDGSGVRLLLDQSAYELLKSREQVTISDFVLEKGRSVRLDLHRVRIYDDQTVFVTGTPSGDKPAPPPELIPLAGSVHGVPGSSAFLGLSRTGINGFVTLGDSTFVLSSGPHSIAPSGSLECAITSLDAVSRPGGSPWSCDFQDRHLRDLEVSPASGRTATDGAPGEPVCRVAIDCDYQYFKEMGEDEAAGLDYVAVLLAAASSIYERDVGVALRLSFVRVWTTPDPYQTCGAEGLDAFRSSFHPAGPPANIGFKFSGCGGAGGAIGIVSCENAGTSSMAAAAGRVVGFFPYPIVTSDDNWDLYMVAHEIGHLFGSPHTHCYDPPLDSCHTSEQSCYNGPKVCSRGSIMSYCFECGGYSNIDLVFPPRVADIMRQRVTAACMEVSSGGFYVCNDEARVLHVDSIMPAVTWLIASREAFLIGPADSLPVALEVDWGSFATQQQTGQVSVFIDGNQTPIVLTVTANRLSPIAAIAASTASGCAPLSVQFTDQSTGNPDAWLWQFGDGDTSHGERPLHVYMHPGTYTAHMGASNVCGSSTAQPVVVTVNGPACYYNSPIILNRGQTLNRAYDLQTSAGGMVGSPDSLRFEITASSPDSCGARIDGGHYLSISPIRSWAGKSVVTIRTTDPRGCTCERGITVIVNIPPTIDIQSPSSAYITNHDFVIVWTNENPDDDGMITLYRSNNPDCSNPIQITGKPIFEDQIGAVGDFVWVVTGVPDGRYYIKARITDQAASAEDCSPGSIEVDLTPPVTTLSGVCELLDSNGWCRSEGVVTLAATDNLTGIAKTVYRVNKTGWVQYRRPFKIDAQGLTTVEYFSIDGAGNSERLHSSAQPFRIDTRRPYISNLAVNDEGFVNGDYMTSTPAFSFQLLDDGSGIDLRTVRVTITPGTLQDPVVLGADSAGFSYDTVSYTVRVTTASPLARGHQTLTVDASDRVGNTSTMTADFRVDPTLRLENVITFPNPTPGAAQFTFTLTQEASVSIRVYDLSGNLMRHMSDIHCGAGYNAIPWDGTSDKSAALAGGTYVYEITAVNSGGTARRLEKLAVLR
jgi:PKD repeat protein